MEGFGLKCNRDGYNPKVAIKTNPHRQTLGEKGPIRKKCVDLIYQSQWASHWHFRGFTPKTKAFITNSQRTAIHQRIIMIITCVNKRRVRLNYGKQVGPS